VSGLGLKPPEKVWILQKKLYLKAKLDGTRCIRVASIGFFDRLNLPYCVCVEVNPVGKPCAVDPHARFDERGWETGLYATAPVLDSTIDPLECMMSQKSFFEMVEDKVTALYHAPFLG